MRFQHSTDVRAAFPGLVAGVVVATGVTPRVDAQPQVADFSARARARLAGGAEAGLAEIQAWRRAYAALGLKPTQYRCAAEALLRRLRIDGELPRLHPLVDLCNAVSAAYAIPVAALDLDRVSGNLTVRHAIGDEEYVTFAGDVERPQPGEITFVDAAGRAHARRWTNRQSGWSAVRPQTSNVLIVAEALHDTAAADVPRLVDELSAELTALWSAPVTRTVLDGEAPGCEVPTAAGGLTRQR
ncbi:B3/4 domain-containing protein [Micromonospora krabiensis]|uniref:B3/B4 domain-containing protein (DNA/RNA-binding domain of Phe-tRNA-synthetase) n=1 Tax=Micromonospora krabiensis TaxID=307121 RepID=A0A1C3MX69_9ACTN|nr:phenylalanine--tRNA ligase beta subunit-related protein [Micromonospora krabiensis]SBV24923.1 B3/B4 domain-containing protein (DNA/RNA-binding domain of Phe-tRNA-synthetase) [Micromonospora krabiensis]